MRARLRCAGARQSFRRRGRAVRLGRAAVPFAVAGAGRQRAAAPGTCCRSQEATAYFNTTIASNSTAATRRPTQVAFSRYSSRARNSFTSGPEIKPFVIRTSTPAQGFRRASQWRSFHSSLWVSLTRLAALCALKLRRIQQMNPYTPGIAAATARTFSTVVSISLCLTVDTTGADGARRNSRPR